jgi:hypothetical protein
MKTRNMTTLSINNSISRSPLRLAFLLVSLVLACFGLSPAAQAVSPPPDGEYPSGNTAEGQAALLSLTSGGFNTAVGFFSLRSDTAGAFNTALGAGTLFANTGDGNTATGAGALLSNTTGVANTANGAFALFSNTTSNFNTAVGHSALQSIATGDGGNTAIGSEALFSTTTGCCNTASGNSALLSNTTGNSNTAIGSGALLVNTTGSNNIGVGPLAGFNLTTGDNNIDIGSDGFSGGEANAIHIGNDNQTATYIAGISGATVAAGVTVIVDAGGHLGTIASSARFKDQIKPMDKASEAILALKPVTFRYKREFDPECTPQFGLVAEEVAKVNPDLVVRDGKGDIYTVRYDAVNAMLLNEFLKEHKKVAELEGTVTSLVATMKEQGAQIQKVSAQFEMSKAKPNVVLNKP